MDHLLLPCLTFHQRGNVDHGDEKIVIDSVSISKKFYFRICIENFNTYNDNLDISSYAICCYLYKVTTNVNVCLLQIVILDVVRLLNPISNINKRKKLLKDYLS